jgi:hypothetical protein
MRDDKGHFLSGGEPWNKGKTTKPLSPEHRAKLSAAMKKIHFTPVKLYEEGHIPWMTGRKHSPEARATISAKLMGNQRGAIPRCTVYPPWTPERRAAQALRMKGVRRNKWIRNRMSKAIKAAWARRKLLNANEDPEVWEKILRDEDLNMNRAGGKLVYGLENFQVDDAKLRKRKAAKMYPDICAPLTHGNIKLTCAYCKKTFTITHQNYQARLTAQKTPSDRFYCSHACSGTHHGGAKKQTTELQVEVAT